MQRLFFILAVVWLGCAPSVLAQGVRAESQHFILLSEAEVDASALLSDLERFRTAVMTDMDLEPGANPTPLHLNIINDPETFQLITPGGITAAIYLQSAAGHDIVVGYSSQPGHFLSQALEPGWLRLVLRHEVVHHILETHYARKLPVWLGEGLAEYYSTFEPSPDGRALFGRALPEQDPLSEASNWLPMRTVIESMVKYPDFRAASTGSLFRAQRLYYGQSWALAHFVMDQPDGLAKIHNFVDDWSPLQDSEDSFERAFGLRYEPLEARVREDIIQDGGNLRLNDLTQRELQPITVSTPTQIEIDENRLRLLLTHGHLGDSTYDRIDAVRELIMDPADSDALDLAEALRSWRLKDWDASDAAAERILARQPNHPAALKLRAKTAYGRVSERQMDDALWTEAESVVISALAVSPDDAELHLFRVAVSRPDTDRLSPGARRSLNWLADHGTHLKLPHTAMMMIPALIYENRFDHADAVLDSAARWTENSSDKFVIERLRGNVAAERAVAP